MCGMIMKKEMIIVFFSIIAIIFFTSFGWLVYQAVKLNKAEAEKNIAMEQVLVEDECTEFAEGRGQAIETAMNEEKISPNAICIFKTYYNDCKHTEIRNLEVPKELVNKGKQDMEDYYNKWEVKGFSNNEIVLYREINGFCDEHYKLKVKEGNISVYHLDENGVEKWEKDTDINAEFLPEEDRNKVEDGLEIIGRENLNKVLEDFE